MVSRIVLLDTNALLMPFQFRVNLETELTRLMGPRHRDPRAVLTELELWQSGSGRSSGFAARRSISRH